MAFKSPATGDRAGYLTPVGVNADGTVSEWGRQDDARVSVQKKDGKFGFRSWEERTAGVKYEKDFASVPLVRTECRNAHDRAFKP